MRTEEEVTLKLNELYSAKSEMDTELLVCDDWDDREWIYSRMAFNSLQIEMVRWVLNEITNLRKI